MDCSPPGLQILHYHSELAQTHVHWVRDAIQPSNSLHPLLFPPSIFPSIRVFSSESALTCNWQSPLTYHTISALPRSPICSWAPKPQHCLIPWFLLLDFRMQPAILNPSIVHFAFPGPVPHCTCALPTSYSDLPVPCRPVRREPISDSQFPRSKTLFPWIDATPGLKKQKMGIRAALRFDILSHETMNLQGEEMCREAGVSNGTLRFLDTEVWVWTCGSVTHVSFQLESVLLGSVPHHPTPRLPLSNAAAVRAALEGLYRLRGSCAVRSDPAILCTVRCVFLCVLPAEDKSGPRTFLEGLEQSLQQGDPETCWAGCRGIGVLGNRALQSSLFQRVMDAGRIPAAVCCALPDGLWAPPGCPRAPVSSCECLWWGRAHMSGVSAEFVGVQE